MASFAHTAHPSQQVQYVSFGLLERVANGFAGAVRSTFQRWAAARRQSVQDRMFWELALTDHRVMAELNAIKDFAEMRGTGKA